MAGKDFEHQVQDRLHNWGMDPSDVVWGKLEASLQKRRRRRRGYIVFLLTGLLAAGGLGYLVTHPVDTSTAVAQHGSGNAMQATGDSIQAPLLEHPETRTVRNAGIRDGKAPDVDELSKKAPSNAPPDSDKSSSKTNTLPAKEMTIAGRQALAKQSPFAREQATAKLSPGVQAGSPGTDKRKSRRMSQPLAEEPTLQTKANTTLPGVDDASSMAKVPADRVIEPTLASVAPVTALHHDRSLVHGDASIPLATTGLAENLAVAPLAADAKQLPETDNRERRLAFGIAAGLGRSGFSDGLLLAQEKAADAQGSGASGGLPVNPYEYRQDPATGFSFGAWMRMPIAKRITGNIGLAYAQWSTRTPVGQSLPDTGRVFNNGIADFTSSVAYTQGSQETYRNNYHLLQMPLDLSWQLNKGRKLPLLWEIGISPGLLLSSNALVRDSARALFSHPDNQRRFQLGLRTAFMFRLMPSSARPIDFGPVFQYQLNEVFNDAVRDNGHLYYLGVEARMPLFFLAHKQRGR